MKYYAGLDVSLDNTAICVVDRDGKVLQEGEAPSEPEAIHAWLAKTGLSFDRLGLEAGGLSSWLCTELLALKYPAICIEVKHAKAAMKAQQMKTDRNDARGIAHIMRTGWFKPVHIKSLESQKLRVLLNNRRCLLSKRLDIDSQIRGTLRVFGKKVGKVTAFKYDARIQELIEGDPEIQAYILPMLQVRKPLVEQCRKLDKMILNYVKNDQVCRLLMTVPGVGPLTSLAYKTTIDCPSRFRRSRDVGPAIGLTPRKIASGTMDYNGRITKCGDSFLRSHLFEAAKCLMSRKGMKPNPLKSWGLRIARRSTMKNACVAVSRRLAITMHAMWRSGTEFDSSLQAA